MVIALLGVGCGSSSSDTGFRDGGATPSRDTGTASPPDGGQCHDLFGTEPDGASPAVPCCPEPAPDCSTLADGYPGYLCVERSNQFCSCSCSQHVWACAC